MGASLADVEVREIRNLVFRLNELLLKKDDPSHIIKNWDYLYENSGTNDHYEHLNFMYKKLGDSITELFLDEVERKNRVKKVNKKNQEVN